MFDATTYAHLLTPEATPATCPGTGRSATACETTTHVTCPTLWARMLAPRATRRTVTGER